MAASSETSDPSDKRRTKQAAKLTQEEALQILQSAAAMCQDSGLSVYRSVLHERGVTMAAIVISGATWTDGNLVPVLVHTTGKGDE